MYPPALSCIYRHGRRTFSKMGVDAHIPSCPREALVFSVRDVLVGDGVDILFRQTKI